ncbi:MAG: beta-eliminating lyase-related protein [Ferroplasma sp.]|uniref:beta-eliminating lyase-related protein n=1 Tax=Ferroplasma sp. TaxID=2591003 RepID=UPI002815FA98|nr:beta-eliminating lyase-related protein [Ferroplasma sp.]WMT50894.1 MAG: beta-eliminating lyase-related protein [Ferroplasma sp.]
MDTADLIEKYNTYRNNTLNLQASENVLSPHARAALSSDMASRYSLNIGEYNAYGGTGYYDSILDLLEKNTKKLFGSKYSESRPLSGHIAAEISLLSVLGHNRNVMAVSEEDGGYPGYSREHLDRVLGYRLHDAPYKNFDLDYDALEAKIRETGTGILILGQSMFIKPYNMKIINEIKERTGIKVLYDASHVMGLLAGKAFQPDALKYSDIVYGSTHKTFFGPQGGIIITNEEDIAGNINENTIFNTMDNVNLSRVASLSIAVEEMIKYGEQYAKKVVENTKNLSTYLREAGFNLLPGTEESKTHQLLLDEQFLRKKGFDNHSFSVELENNRIIIDRFGRIGTQEITRWGINSMDVVADALSGISNKLNKTEEINTLITEKKLRFW